MCLLIKTAVPPIYRSQNALWFLTVAKNARASSIAEVVDIVVESGREKMRMR